jgi:hypothetical protein
VAGIVGDDHVGASREGCRDDVAVTFVDLIRNNRREPLRSWGHRLGEGGLHLLATSPKPLGMLGPSLGQAIDDLVEDLGTPSRSIETALGQPQEQVADNPRVENARVEQPDIRHELLLVVDAKLLSLGRHVSEHRLSLLTPAPSVGQDIVESNAPVRSHPVVGNLAGLEEANQERPRHVHEVSRLLRGQLQTDGEDGDTSTTPKLVGRANEDRVQRLGQLSPRPVRADDLRPLIGSRTQRTLDRVERSTLGFVRDDRFAFCDSRCHSCTSCR